MLDYSGGRYGLTSCSGGRYGSTSSANYEPRDFTIHQNRYRTTSFHHTDSMHPSFSESSSFSFFSESSSFSSYPQRIELSKPGPTQSHAPHHTDSMHPSFSKSSAFSYPQRIELSKPGPFSTSAVSKILSILESHSKALEDLNSCVGHLENLKDINPAIDRLNRRLSDLEVSRSQSSGSQHSRSQSSGSRHSRRSVRGNIAEASIDNAEEEVGSLPILPKTRSSYDPSFERAFSHQSPPPTSQSHETNQFAPQFMRRRIKTPKSRIALLMKKQNEENIRSAEALSPQSSSFSHQSLASTSLIAVTADLATSPSPSS